MIWSKSFSLLLEDWQFSLAVALDVESSQESKSIKNKCKMLHARYNILNLQNKLFIPKVGCAIIASTQQLKNVLEIGEQTTEINRKKPASFGWKPGRKNNIVLNWNYSESKGMINSLGFWLFSPLIVYKRTQGPENFAELQIWCICLCCTSVFLCK